MRLLNPFRKKVSCTLATCGKCVEVRAQEVAEELARATAFTSRQLFHYALAVVVIGMPVDRALTYIQDCGSPDSALGRLYGRAAERAWRESGEQVKYNGGRTSTGS